LNWRRNLWSLWVCSIISSSSYTMVVPFLPLYLHDLGVTDKSINIWAGLIFAASFLMSALTSPYWGRLADKTGKRRMVIRSGVSLAAVYFLGAFVESPLQLLVVRLLQGVATGFMPASLAIVASSVPEERTGFSLGLMQTATLTGGIIGPVLGGGLAHVFGIRTSFMVSGAIILGAAIAVRLLVTEPPRHELPASGSVADDLRQALTAPVLRTMLLLIALAQIAVMALQPLVTLHVAELRGSLEGAVLASGFVFSAAGVAGAVAAPLWGRLGQQAGYGRILAAVFAGAGLATFLVCFTADIWLFGLLQFAFGLFIAGVNPSVNTIMVMNSDAAFRGRAFGLIMSAHQLGSMIGPLISGPASAWTGIGTMFAVIGLMLAAVGLVVWRRPVAP
jgi:DHA1 family multidrug resistance protein-like MFS transporter